MIKHLDVLWLEVDLCRWGTQDTKPTVLFLFLSSSLASAVAHTGRVSVRFITHAANSDPTAAAAADAAAAIAA